MPLRNQKNSELANRDAVHRAALLQEVDSRILEASLQDVVHRHARIKLDRTEVAALHIEHLEGAGRGVQTNFGRESDGRAATRERTKATGAGLHHAGAGLRRHGRTGFRFRLRKRMCLVSHLEVGHVERTRATTGFLRTSYPSSCR